MYLEIEMSSGHRTYSILIWRDEVGKILRFPSLAEALASDGCEVMRTWDSRNGAYEFASVERPGAQRALVIYDTVALTAAWAEEV